MNDQQDLSTIPDELFALEAKRRGWTKGKKIADRSEAFEQCWKAYPRKIGKGAAAAAFSRHGCATFVELILVAIERGKRSEDWTKENGAYIPHLSTWLNRWGWEDHFTPANQPVVKNYREAPRRPQ